MNNCPILDKATFPCLKLMRDVSKGAIDILAWIKF